MVKYQSSRLPKFRWAFCLACCIGLSLANAGERKGTEWKITTGDTLYQIGRSIYPGDAGKQSRLRQDIMMLNPNVFATDTLNMQPGVVLKLPGYVVDPQAARPAAAPLKPAPAATTTPPGPVANDATRANWIVKRGDSLYSIARSVYPQDTRKQAFLRQDIVKLNRSAFASGVDNLAVGTVLRMPGYVGQGTQKSAAKIQPAPTPAPVVAPVVTKPAPAASKTPEPAAKAVASPEPVNKRKTSPPSSSPNKNFLISLGLAYGGDKLVVVDNGPDITGGSGINLRLGYQHLPLRGHGYRAALGLQYHSVTGATLQDTYLQLAYQYHANPYVYGVGVVSHSGADVEDVDISYEFDPSTGLYVYLENTGAGTLGGWGLSLTALEMQEKDSGDKVDASSVEVYYSWNF